jgi:hypothetical protein
MGDNETPAATDAPAGDAPTPEAPSPEVVPNFFTDPPAEETPAPTGDAPPAEKPADAPVEAKPEEGPTSKDWATYHRKAKELRQNAERIKASEQKYRQFEELQAKVKDNPLAIAEMFGQDVYERMTMALIGQDKAAPGPEDRVRQLEERIAAREKAEQDQQKAAQESQRTQSIETAKAAALATAKSDSGKYRHLVRIDDTTAKALIWEKTQELHKAHGDALTDALVLAGVEADLVAFKQLLADEASDSQSAANGARAIGSKTLTSRGVSGMSTPTNGHASLPLSADDRDKEIMKRFQFYTTGG